MAPPLNEDMGFCSSEDYYDNGVHSPTDSSEDSVEVKVSTITLKNTRKRFDTSSFTGPLKKRMCLKVKAEINEGHPFRPWSPSPTEKLKSEVISTTNVNCVSSTVSDIKIKTEEHLSVPSPNLMCQTTQEPTFTYFRPPSPINFYQQTEPVPLIKKLQKDDLVSVKTESDTSFQDVRVPIHPQIQSLSTAETERMILKTTELFPALQNTPSTSTKVPSTTLNVKKNLDSQQRREQRNYKNMTRERRIEANARERTRVHTISAAFDTLRNSIPSYSHNQKLSKLSVLRIACSYIMTLSSIVNSDEPESGEPSTAECVDLVSRTIQREGKLRKKKDDND